MTGTILVTGASRGIGQAIVQELLAAGHRVVAHATSAASWQNADLRTHPHLSLLNADLADPEAVTRLVKELRQNHGDDLVGLVNNAGIALDKPLAFQSVDDIERMIAVNLRAPILLCKVAAKLFAARGQGSIVNISSVVGQSGNAFQCVYAATKAGLIGFTMALAKEMSQVAGSDRIRVNAVSPGFIDTDMTKRLGHDIAASILGAIPMRRMGLPREVAKVVAFLLAEDSSYIHGQTINVNGGMYA